jgi:signal transduction histidine kinase
MRLTKDGKRIVARSDGGHAMRCWLNVRALDHRPGGQFAARAVAVAAVLSAEQRPSSSHVGCCDSVLVLLKKTLAERIVACELRFPAMIPIARFICRPARPGALVFPMLHDFIIVNREKIIDRARRRAGERTAAKSTDAKLEHRIRIFLAELADALAQVALANRLHQVGATDTAKEIAGSAALHGHELLRDALTVAQAVNGYGDVRQIVTELAIETKAAISTQDFHVFGRCLDDAVAGALTAYGDQRERELACKGMERLGVLAHELRNLLNTATLSFAIIKEGKVGLGGSTAAMHARSLSGLCALVDRSVAEVRLEAGMPQLERVSMVEFIEEIKVGAALHAAGHDLQLTVRPVDSDLAIDADRQLLASAVSNLLQNAFKFTRPNGKVSLITRATADRVLIDVCDECGGLPAGKAEVLFRPLHQGSSDRSGLGLGLSSALSAVRANSGDIHVRDVPGAGCVFTVDLPRRPPSAQV